MNQVKFRVSLLAQIFKSQGIDAATQKTLTEIYKTYHQNVHTIHKNTNEEVTIKYINPNNITHETESILGSKRTGPNTYSSGYWDQLAQPFRKRFKIQSLCNHINNDIQWKDTAYFSRIQHYIENKGQWRGIKTEDMLLNYLNRYDEFYSDMGNSGYSTSGNIPSPDLMTDGEKITVQSRPDEIGVTVGRNGDYFWHSNGQHRLCLAQLANIELVPVVILTTHTQLL